MQLELPTVEAPATVIIDGEVVGEGVATVTLRKPRGFAAMDPAKVREIASKGGRAAHAAGTAHTFTTEEARLAGIKGGRAPHVRRGRGPRA